MQRQANNAATGNEETAEEPMAAAARKRQSTVFAQVQTERQQLHATRAHLFEQLENQLGRPVVTFFTSFAYPVQVSNDDADMLEGMLRQMDLSKGVALLVSTPGGDGEAAERIINLCRNYSDTGEYWAIVPGKAKSAGTIICFGASRILMGPNSELGPVDPQIIFAEKGARRQHSAYNLVTSFEQLFADAVECQGNLEPFLQQLEHYDARDIQRFKELIELADDITIKALRTGMLHECTEDQIREKVARFLKPTETKSHGRPIFRDGAKECSLNVENVEPEHWDVIYELYIRTNELVSSSAMKAIETADDSFVVPVSS